MAVWLKNLAMPYVKIEITREGVTPAQKEAIARGVNDLITNVLNKDPKLTYVVIQHLDPDDWGLGDELVSVLREKGITVERKQ
jgi:4-oxalocrotonate tautomerase